MTPSEEDAAIATPACVRPGTLATTATWPCPCGRVRSAAPVFLDIDTALGVLDFRMFENVCLKSARRPPSIHTARRVVKAAFRFSSGTGALVGAPLDPRAAPFGFGELHPNGSSSERAGAV